MPEKEKSKEEGELAKMLEKWSLEEMKEMIEEVRRIRELREEVKLMREGIDEAIEK